MKLRNYKARKTKPRSRNYKARTTQIVRRNLRTRHLQIKIIGKRKGQNSRDGKRNIHVWRHKDIVVASLSSFLQRGQVMHVCINSLFTFTTCPAISPCLYTTLHNKENPEAKRKKDLKGVKKLEIGEWIRQGRSRRGCFVGFSEDAWVLFCCYCRCLWLLRLRCSWGSMK